MRLAILINDLACALQSIDVGPNGVINVGLSAGIAVFPDDPDDAESLVRAGDEAMYQSKVGRRRTAEFYSAILKYSGSSVHLAQIQSLMWMLKAKDRYTYFHSERLAEYAVAVGESLGLNETDLELLKSAALLHDLGKLDLDYKTLNKSGPLSEVEWAAIRQHPQWSYALLEAAGLGVRVLEAVLYHHERWDGQGYLHGLVGEDIPLWARIIGIADAFDAMTSERPYRSALSHDAALAELARCSGTQFDPNLVPIFSSLVRSEQAPERAGSSRVS